MASHRYWRIRALTIPGAFFEHAETRLTSGGARVDGTATLSSSIAPDFGSITSLNDSELGTRCYWTAAHATDAGFWIQWDFGAATDVDGYQFAGFDTSNRYASGLTVEASDDASSWTAQAVFSGLPYPGNATYSPVSNFPVTSFDGVGAVVLQITAAGTGAHTPAPIVGSGAGVLSITLEGLGAHGVAGMGAAVLSLVPAGAGLHPRYRLHGQILDGGVAVTAVRRVRAHKRSTGAVIGEADTVAGVFDIPVGYALDEFYIVPLDLDSSATDWAPPVANRVLSVLVSD